jgi:hypothetical protein
MISTRAHRSSETFSCMIAGWHVFDMFSSLLSLQYSLADDVEVVKSVSPDEMEKRDENSDQVALETVEQEVKALPPPNHIVQVQGEFAKKIVESRERAKLCFQVFRSTSELDSLLDHPRLHIWLTMAHRRHHRINSCITDSKRDTYRCHRKSASDPSRMEDPCLTDRQSFITATFHNSKQPLLRLARNFTVHL